MATPIVEFAAPSGMTLTATLHAIGSDTVLKTASSVVEQTNRKGVYRASFNGTGLAYARCQIVAKAGTSGVAVWYGYIADSNNTYVFSEFPTAFSDDATSQNSRQIASDISLAGNEWDNGADALASINWNYSTRTITGGTVTTVSDKTGYGLANGSIAAATFAANAITASSLAADSVLEIADGIWDELMSGHSIAGSYGAHFVRSANQNQSTVQITGSQHIAADIHELQPAVIDSSHFSANAIDANALATSAVTEIADAVGGGGAGGAGSVSVPFTVTDNASNPIDGVALWVSTDSAGTNVIAGTIYTNGSGLATFMLDPGTYYVWLQRNGYNFTNPQTLTVT